jgi:hypothetical protein
LVLHGSTRLFSLTPASVRPTSSSRCGSDAGFWRQLAAITAWGSPDESKLNRLAGITQPTFVANGDNDTMMHTHNSHLLADRLPDAELRIYPSRVAADRQGMATIHELEAQATGRSDPRWLIEELRGAQLAPGEYIRRGATVKCVCEALLANAVAAGDHAAVGTPRQRIG